MSTDSWDVIVVGLGGMGAAAAWQLAKRGQRVLGIEQFEEAHGKGSSHGSTRMIRQAYFEDPAYVPLLLRSYELWDELGSAVGRPMIFRTGGLMIGQRSSAPVAGALASAAAWGLPHELLDPAAVARRWPTLRLAPTEQAFYEANAGWVRPERTVQAHLDLARAAGAVLMTDTPALGWDVVGDGVEVRTPSGLHRAGRLVLCVGAWAPHLLARLGLPLVVERQIQHWFAPVAGTGAFGGDHPVYIWECDDGVQFYGFPATDGPAGGVKVAFFRRGGPADPDAFDTSVSVAEVEDMRSYVRDRVPALDAPYLRGEPCLYTTTPDEDFVIDTVPDHPQVVVAGGFSGHGFKFTPVVGELLAQLVVGGQPGLPLEPFRMTRFVDAALQRFPSGGGTPPSR